MSTIPSGKGLPPEILVPFGKLVVRPALVRTTPTIRRSIAAATRPLPDLIATGRNGSFDYIVRRGIYPTNGPCSGNFWTSTILTAVIGLDHRSTYSFDDDDGVIIKVQGEDLPATSHGGRGQPVSKLINHPLLAAIDPEFDTDETVREVEIYDESDDDDPDAWGLEIEIGGDLVPLYPDIFEG